MHRASSPHTHMRAHMLPHKIHAHTLYVLTGRCCCCGRLIADNMPEGLLEEEEAAADDDAEEDS